MAPSSIFDGSNSMSPQHALGTGHVGVPWVFANPHPPCLSEMVETSQRSSDLGQKSSTLNHPEMVRSMA